MGLNLVHENWQQLLALAVVVVVAFYTAERSRAPRYGKPLPAPRGLPLLGHVFELGAKPWLKMTEWSKALGPIFQLNFGGRSVIVLNSYQVAADILDKKSSTTSGRPRLIMAAEIMCDGHAFELMPYTDQWRRLRKMAHESLNSRAAVAYDGYQEREARLLVKDIMKGDDRWSDHFYRAIASSTLSLAYALPSIKDRNDKIVIRIHDFMQRLETAARPGNFMVDILPWLNYLPDALASWRREGNKMHQQDDAYFKNLLRESTTNLNGPCVAAQLSPKIERGEVTEKEAAWLSGTLFGAAFSTTLGVLHVLVLAMVLHPHVMKKAQAEIDAVVGRHRLPSASDRSKLVYCLAVLREACRWRGVIPFGVPHSLDQDEEYEGYHLPKGSIILFNEWAMNQDVSVYGDPEVFRPERFLNESETAENIPANTHGEGHTSFGYGRRKCPGSTVANNTLLLNIATLLWAFDIVKSKDENGNEISPNPDAIHEDGVVAVPEPFPCRFVPRDLEQLSEVLN